jgi:hypothetical protein
MFVERTDTNSIMLFCNINHKEKRTQDGDVKRFLVYLCIETGMGHEA